ncbi:MAG: pantothenate synthetase [Saprospiraceae bacterium]|nr:MAG: pantothenate synthetase [Saprospiraceae bacterium]
MYLFKKVSDLQHYLKLAGSGVQNLGFVPTMGALHEGHLSLIRLSKTINSHTVCSIFVNPTQFNEKGDLALYPRTPGKDIELLEKVGCEVLFLPEVEEVYPPEVQTKLEFDFKGLDKVMEGTFRPGHFNGVAQVVKRLLDIVQPDRLYMGQKDFQQFTIIEQMIRQLHLPVELVMGETLREADGLALSSRNLRLSPEHRQLAPKIYETLKEVLEWRKKYTPVEVQKNAMQALDIPGFKPEYFEIVNRNNLLPIQGWENLDQAVVCTAVWAGNVRLIDNLLLNQ